MGFEPIWLNGWVFVYELSSCRFESRCCHINFILLYCRRYDALSSVTTYSDSKMVLEDLLGKMAEEG